MLKCIAGIACNLSLITFSFASGQDQLPTFDEDQSTPEFKDARAKQYEALSKELSAQHSTTDKRSERILPLAEFLVTNEDAFETIELSRDQRERIKKVLNEYDKKLQGIKDKYAKVTEADERNRLISREANQLGYACNKFLLEELLDFQLDYLAKWQPERIGIAKTLTDSAIGKAIGLSDEQRDRIRKDANALGERMLADFEKYKEDAAKIVFDSLTDTQKERLSQALEPSGTRPLTGWIMNRNVSQLANELDYRKDEFDPSKYRSVVNGKVYDGFGNLVNEDPEEVKRRLKGKKE